jgi:hypothetical protein
MKTAVLQTSPKQITMETKSISISAPEGDDDMSENKTRPTNQNVIEFLSNVENETRREDSFTLLKMMEELTGETAVLWGSSIVGFGKHHYKYESGREGDMPNVGFSPRKQSMTLYIMPGFDDYEDLLAALGKHKLGKACLYINKLADVDQPVLRNLIKQAFDHMRETNQ